MNLTSPKNWKTVKLGDIGKVITGKTPSKDNPEDWGFGVPFITPTDIKDGEMFCNPERHLSDNGEIRFKNLIVPKNTILYTCIASVGKMCLSDKPTLTNQQINSLIIDTEKADYKFIFYLLKFITPRLKSIAGGTMTSIINKTQLESFEVQIPESPDDQREIASILGSLDDKIELLRRENKTLESIAQTLFKEWFVDFRFPGYEMVKVIGGAPEGWKTFYLSELVQVINGYSYKGSELKGKSNEALVTLKSFDRNGGFQTRGFKPFSGNPKPEQEVFVGDLVVAHTDLTQDAEVLGNPAFIFENGGFEKMYITMDLVKINSKIKQIKTPFLYFLMQTPNFKSHCVGYSNGTTVLHLSKKAIPEYKIILPEDLEFCEKFSDFAEQSTKKISNNISEIQTLSKLRDNLLSKIFR